ncbi:hypothetical protein [Streptomyces sp. bgisy153]|uniref:hypothetical protein n=1 Tax=Streptomyces sp. bgisy153 TaxID=3413793 RepID=UPI003D76387A
MTTNAEPEEQVTSGTETGVRSVDDFLADLDTVLEENIAPAPAPAEEPPAVESEAVAVPAAEALPPAAPAQAVPQPRQVEWWRNIYGHQDADLDTFTGNTDPVRPAQPPGDPVAPPPGDTPADADADPDEDEAEQSDQADDDAEDGRPWWALKKRQPADDSAPEAGQSSGIPPAVPNSSGASKKATAAVAASGDGLINNPRGRQVLFAATAYAFGWGLGLDDMATGLMEQAAQYALPVAGCSLAAGVLGLSARNKFGGVVFVSSLGLITLLEMASPARVVGGGLALGLQIAYRFVRKWVGPYGDRWPWKGVVWAAHVPAATSTVAFLLYGTN